MDYDAPSPSPRFFVLKRLNEGQHDTEFDTVDLHTGPPLHHCPQCGDPVGPLSWQPPYQGTLELYGKDYGDFIECSGDDLLVTERFAEDFKAEGLTGLHGFHPVEVLRVRRMRRGPKPGPPPRYLTVTVSYGPTALDMDRSRIWSKKPMKCSGCGYAGIYAIDGLALNEATWNGEDVFRPRNLSGVIIVSERFMRFAERHAMSNLAFVPSEKYVWDPLGHYYPRPVQLQPPSKG